MSVNTTSDELEALIRIPIPRRSLFWLSVEIPSFLLLFCSSLTDIVTYNLLLYRACMIDLDYNSTKCALLNNLNKTAEAKDVEKHVQVEASILIAALAVFSSIMPAVLAAFLGSWSDKYGRKPLVVWPLVGHVVTSVLTVVFSGIPSLSAYWFVVCVLPLAMLGGSSAIILGTNLIITDITDEDKRSFRLALLQGCGYAGTLTGATASSYVYDLIGYVPMFSLSATIYFFILLYIILFVKETIVTVERGSLLNLFDCSLIKDMARTCFKKRELIIAAILALLITAYGITTFCNYGVDAVDYLFTRQKFHWLLKDYSVYSAMNMILAITGMLLAMYFFQSYFKMTDGVLLILAYLSSVSDAVVRSLSQETWQMYLAGLMSMLENLSSPLIRSMITKVLPRVEVAKMYSLVSCVEAAMPLIAPILFSWIYHDTLAVYPGFIYVVSGALFSVSLLLVIIANSLFCRMLKNRAHDRHSCPDNESGNDISERPDYLFPSEVMQNT